MRRGALGFTGRPLFHLLIYSGRGRFWLERVDADLEPKLVLMLELDDTVDHGVNREVRAQANIAAGGNLRPTLADDDVPSAHVLAAELLHATILRIRIAAVAR